MTVHILAVSIVSFFTGIVLCLYVRKPDRLNLFILLVMLIGVVSGIAGAITRMEIEKTRARIDEVKRLDRTLSTHPSEAAIGK